MERFQPKLGLGDGEEGQGGTIKFLKSDREAESDGSQPILVAGEEAAWTCPTAAARGSATPASESCAPAVSATCATARSTAQEGEVIRTCIHAPEGPIEIEL